MTTLLFISGAEILVILFIVIMVFGADKLPGIAHSLGKGMKQLRNATDDIKNEIRKTAEKQGFDKELTQSVSEEVNKVKDEIKDIGDTVKRNL